MITQKLVGTVIDGLGAPVSGTITATTFPNSVVSTDLVKKTVITAPVGIDGKFVLYVPKLVECSIKITFGTTTVYSTVIEVTNDDELDLSVYAASPPPNVADPFTLHMQDTTIHAPAGTGHTHDNKAALDLVSGTNTGDQDLSGYSTTTHNHSLNNLTEKSYNSLTDKPTMPSISGLLDETAHDALDHAGLTGIPSISGLLNESSHDALDHTGLTGIPTAYSLPTASTTVLGGVKIDGTTILISDGVISSTGGAGGGVTEHGLLTGLSDDDHSQYLNETRHDALDHTGLTGIPTAYTNEMAQDATGTLITNGTQSGITVTYDDANNKIDFTVTATGTGDVTGPAGSVDSNFALFNGTTGKIIKDGSVKASDFATASHNHTGVYQPLGTYSTDIHSNITALNAVSGTNTGDQDLSGFSLTSHTHAGVYEPADATILKDADIGVTVQAYDADLTSWAAIAPSAKQDTLVSGTNIKTINSTSILGEGNIVIEGGSGSVTLVFPFYKSNGTADTIQMASGYELPFYKADGNADNIVMVTP